MKTEYWNEIPALLTDDMTISADAVRLWVKLYNSNRGKKKTYKEWQPTINGLATMFNVTKQTILNWMRELRDKGWISTIGERDNTIVTLHYTPLDTKQVQNISPNATRTGKKNTPKQVQNIVPEQVQNIVPYTNNDALATKVGESASTIIQDFSTEIDDDFNNFFDI